MKQSPQTKTLKIKGCFCADNDCKDLEIRVDVTYTKVSGQNKWSISLEIVTILVVQEKGRDNLVPPAACPTGAVFNDDATLDRYGLTTTGSLETCVSAGGGSFVTTTHGLPSGSHAATVADLDDDGFADIAVSASTSGTVRLFWNDGAGSFTPSDIFLPGSMAPEDIAQFDLDGDGDLDLIVSSPTTGKIGFLRNDGEQDFQWCGTTSVASHGNPGDDIGFISLGNAAATTWMVKNDSTGNLCIFDGKQQSQTIFIGTGIESFEVRNLDESGAEDVVVWRETTNEIVVVLGDDNGEFVGVSHAIAGTITGFHLEDTDSDGDIDIEVQTTTGTETLVNDGSGSFS